MYQGIERFLSKPLISLEEGISLIQDRFNLVSAMAAAEPAGLLERIGERAKSLRGITLHCANPSRNYSCFTDVSLAGHLEISVMFLTAAVRKHQGHSTVHYVPQHLSQWVKNSLSRRQVDIFWGSCSLPDERGFVSLGPGACYEPEMVRAAKCVILEINPKLPVTFGSTVVPVSRVSHFIYNEHELPGLVRASVEDNDRKIGEYVADLVKDGSTLQLGIGSIPDAIGEALRSKKDLGIHTEMINDTMVELAQRGVVNGYKKTIWPGKIVGAFAFGTESLYHYIDRNPLVELHPASVVNDPYRIGRNHKMVSINTAVEVDITGQVCSESVGHSQLSGVGGASETHIGAQRSPGGRGIIAINAWNDKSQNSKIVFELRPGAKVSIGRNDIDTVVTEFGVAELRGLSVSERVRALVAIADPRAREELLERARVEKYI